MNKKQKQQKDFNMKIYLIAVLVVLIAFLLSIYVSSVAGSFFCFGAGFVFGMISLISFLEGREKRKKLTAKNNLKI
jgi:hypothetical protein